MGALTREISPGEAISCDPHRNFRVCVIGEYGLTYDLDVDASSLPEQESDDRPNRGAGTVLFTRYDLTPGQRRVLSALCAPLLAGEARSATAREIAENLNLRPNYVRNVLKDTRERLAGQGVPGLLGENNPQAVEALRLRPRPVGHPQPRRFGLLTFVWFYAQWMPVTAGAAPALPDRDQV